MVITACFLWEIYQKNFFPLRAPVLLLGITVVLVSLLCSGFIVFASSKIGGSKYLTYDMQWSENDFTCDQGEHAITLTFVRYPALSERYCSNEFATYLHQQPRTIPIVFQVNYFLGQRQSVRIVKLNNVVAPKSMVDTWVGSISKCCTYPEAPTSSPWDEP